MSKGDSPIPPTVTTTSEGDVFLSQDVDITRKPCASAIKPSPADSSFEEATLCRFGVTCSASAFAAKGLFALRFLAAFFFTFQDLSGSEYRA